MTVNHDVTGSSPVGGAKTRCNKIGVDDAEGPPVPMPNTEVKLSSADDSGLVTVCENRKMPISAASFFIIQQYIANEGRYELLFFYTLMILN